MEHLEVRLLVVLFILDVSTSSQNFSCPLKCLCPNVGTISCTWAGIDQIPEDTSPLTTRLFLRGNKFRSIDPKTFSRLTHLEELDLSDNKIVQIHDKSFAALKRLRILNLQGNQIQKTGKSTFHGLRVIHNLNLNSNPLRYFKWNSLNDLNKWTRITLSDNRIPCTCSFATRITEVSKARIVPLNVTCKYKKLSYNPLNSRARIEFCKHRMMKRRMRTFPWISGLLVSAAICCAYNVICAMCNRRQRRRLAGPEHNSTTVLPDCTRDPNYLETRPRPNENFEKESDFVSTESNFSKHSDRPPDYQLMFPDGPRDGIHSFTNASFSSDVSDTPPPSYDTVVGAANNLFYSNAHQ